MSASRRRSRDIVELESESNVRVIKDKFVEKRKKYDLRPRNEMQSHYLNALKTSSVIICTGPAGTGKTFISSAWAANELINNSIKSVILTRPNVPAGPSIGFFKGTIEEKLAPWLAPMTSVMKSIMGPGAFDCALKKENIQMIPLEVMRGYSFEDSIIIVDESSNLTMAEIKVLSTRIGKGSKMIFLGDISQSDIDTSENNALGRFIKLVKKYQIEDVALIEFDVDDVVRSSICSDFVIAFSKEGL